MNDAGVHGTHYFLGKELNGRVLRLFVMAVVGLCLEEVAFKSSTAW